MPAKPRYPRLGDSQKGSLLGPSFSNREISVLLDSVGAVYEYIDDENVLIDRIARYLDGEKIIGWLQGRMEYGPRVLDCRRISGDTLLPEYNRLRT
jgi:carbamoyltransferase